MKRTMKRLLSLFLALAMCLSLLSVSVWATQSPEEDLSVPAAELAQPEAEPVQPAAEESAAEEAPEAEESVPEEAPEAEESEADVSEEVPEAEESAPDESEADVSEAEESESEADVSVSEAEELEPSEEDTLTPQDNTHSHSGDIPGSGIVFEVRNGNSLPATTDGGTLNIALGKNFTLNSTWVIRGTVNLCLNGHNLTLSSNVTSTQDIGCVIKVMSGATLNLYDCQTTPGKIQGGKGMLFQFQGSGMTSPQMIPSGGGVVVYQGGFFNMYGGEISNNTADTGGGVINQGTFNMSGGTISNNKCTQTGGLAKSGGGVLNQGTFILSGGTISGNECAEYGGGVRNQGDFQMSGGKISNNTANAGGGVANTQAAAGSVFTQNAGQFTMSGGEISNNTADAGGGVVNYCTFTMSSSAAISDNSAQSAGGGLYNYDQSGNGTAGIVNMTGGTFSNNTARAGGALYLFKGAMTMSSGTMSGNNSTNSGGAVYMNEGSFLLDGGTLTGNRAGASGGAVYIGTGSFEMKSGSITNNGFVTESGTTTVSTTNGGGIYANGGTLKMSGGEISGNQCKTYGGGVTTDGTFNMSSGKIKNNSCERGGGLFLYSNGTATMTGGEISGNNASLMGGGVFDAGTFNMSTGEISGNFAKQVGGGVAVVGIFKMSGGEIKNNEANVNDTSLGGGLYVQKGGSAQMSGGKISGNKALFAAGMDNEGTFTLTEGSIESNTAGYQGGGIVNGNNAILNLFGGSVTGNSVVSQYGNASVGGVDPAGTVNIKGSPVVKNNTLKIGSGSAVNSNVQLSDATRLIVTDALTNGASIGVKYDGTTLPKVFTTNYKTKNAGEDPTKYFFSDNTSHEVTLVTASGTDEKEAQLSKAPDPITGVSAADVTADYDKAAHTITVTGTPSGSTITYSTDGVSYSSNKPSYTDVNTDSPGYYTIYYKVAKEGYSPFTSSAKVTINPKTVGLSWSNTTFTYDKSAHVPTATATGLCSGDTCAVTVSGEQTNAGENYTATATALGNSNYKLPTAVTQSFTINPKALTLTWGQQTSFEYNGQPHAPTAQLSGVMSGDISMLNVSGVQTNAGENYTATASITVSDNYTKPTNLTRSFSITPKELTLNWGEQTSFEYDGQPHAPTAQVSGLVGSDTCTVNVSGEQTDAGENYTATAASLSNSNYKLPANATTQSFSITPKELTLNWGQQTSFEYDGQPHAPTAQVSGLVGSDTCTVNVSGEQTDAGENYTATAASLSNSNYKLPANATTQSFSITPKELTLNWGQQTSFEYDGQPHAPTAQVSGLVGSDTCTVNVSGEQTDAGENYTATAAGLSNSNYKLPENVTQSFSITPKALTLSWGEQTTFEYDGQPHAPTAQVSGLAKGDEDIVKVEGKKTDAGLYTAALTLANTGNYTLPDNTTCEFAIRSAEAKLAWSNTSFKYDGKAHVPTCKVSNLPDGATCTVTVSGEQTKPGTYTAAAVELSSPNFHLPENPTRSFTIKDAAAEKRTKLGEVQFTPKVYVYNGRNRKPVIGKVLDENGKSVPEKYYTVKCTDNKKCGTASIIVTAKKPYTGVLRRKYTISKGYPLASYIYKNPKTGKNQQIEELKLKKSVNRKKLSYGSDGWAKVGSIGLYRRARWPMDKNYKDFTKGLFDLNPVNPETGKQELTAASYSAYRKKKGKKVAVKKAKGLWVKEDGTIYIKKKLPKGTYYFDIKARGTTAKDRANYNADTLHMTLIVK